ncbi:APC family permease [Georgenia sp. AZ-5]|uniref:APC family permease n=1 Tax=Georgenia sp. AZ-5 TaxID=3367526 RepID=UPI003753ED39
MGSMIGAGVFAVFGPAAQAAGAGLLAGLAVALVVAACNATSTAQLAAVYPSSGGTYVYGRERLGPWWGFAAGWCFVIGKTASAAAMATTFAAYTVPGPWQRPAAVVAVLALTVVGRRGVTRTAAAARVIVAVTLLALAVAVAAALLGAGPVGPPGPAPGDVAAPTPLGVLQAAGLIFFAFAGYARVATLGEEVRDPARTIPRAIVTSLVLVAALYAAVALTLLAVLGPARLAAADAPLADAVAAGSWGWALPVVGAGAAAASLGALLALLAGIGRTTLAMAREGDLPPALAALHPRFRTPHHAETVVGVVVAGAVAVADLRGLIGFSSAGVLLYYAIANLAALTQPRGQRRYPRAMQVLGLAGCVVLVATLPAAAVLAGLAVLAAGLMGRAVTRRRAGRGRAPTLSP